MAQDLELAHKISIPTTVVDNFFEEPDEIRSFALQQDFNFPRQTYPGYRTDHLTNLSIELADFVHNKILLLFFNPFKDMFDFVFESQFQYIPEYFGEGWVHQDIDINRPTFAGVIYLTPNPDKKAGTSIYKQITEPDNENYGVRNDFYLNASSEDIDNYHKIRNETNSHFEQILDVPNIYNRATIYDTAQFHKESKFFGKDKNDSRLTLVFKATIRTAGNTKFPLDRMRLDIKGI